MTKQFKLGSRVSYISYTDDVIPASSYFFVVSDGVLPSGNYRLAYLTEGGAETIFASPDSLILESEPGTWQRDTAAFAGAVGYYNGSKVVVLSGGDPTDSTAVYKVISTETSETSFIMRSELKHPDSHVGLLRFGQRVAVNGAIAYIVKAIARTDGVNTYCAAFPRATPGESVEDYKDSLRVIKDGDFHLVSPAFKETPLLGMPPDFGDILTTGYNAKVLALGPTFFRKPEIGPSENVLPVVTADGEVTARPVHGIPL